jgi:hypothetical protein
VAVIEAIVGGVHPGVVKLRVSIYKYIISFVNVVVNVKVGGARVPELNAEPSIVGVTQGILGPLIGIGKKNGCCAKTKV